MINDFIEAYLSHKYNIELAISVGNKSLDSLENMIKQAEVQLQKLALKEDPIALPDFKTSEESKLIVYVISIEDIKLRLECHGQRIDTQPRTWNEKRIEFHEIFSFDFENYLDELRIEIIGEDDNNTNEITLGESSFSIDQCKDQRKHEVTQVITGKIHATLHMYSQWLFSKVRMMHERAPRRTV
ncbi:multi-pass transmembrane protein [Cardiosporidium cionae]|uniref:Multi-pass transmembrane protein n=1 Tax=Cardiosporidium cionae TaxID=476202 RepID=A0ABQ7JEB3_9APIC|nr:multi-pass transmembrane protein [Cardiosporidium cionae]|eukprot:KAF8822304.1 multi-pass transmembrane protein [Cardiosporidium cionae]